MNENILNDILSEIKEVKDVQGRTEKRLQGISEEIKEIKTIQGRTEKRMDSMDKTIREMSKDIKDIYNIINKGIYVDLERVKDRVTALEVKVG